MPGSLSPSPFDSVRFFELAKELAQQTDEARLRTAVGRAYYAAFLIAKTKTMVVQREGAHNEVRARLMSRPPRGKHLADKLRDLFELRNTADYELVPDDASRTNWWHNWERALLLAEYLIPKLQDL